MENADKLNKLFTDGDKITEDLNTIIKDIQSNDLGDLTIDMETMKNDLEQLKKDHPGAVFFKHFEHEFKALKHALSEGRADSLKHAIVKMQSEIVKFREEYNI